MDEGGSALDDGPLLRFCLPWTLAAAIKRAKEGAESRETGVGAAIPNPIPVKRVNDSDAREYACEILRWNAKFAPLSISLATSGLIFKRRVI